MRVPFLRVRFPIISLLYLALVLAVFFFSFTQVDLGLTLTRASIFTEIQKGFQYIGYFNRPLSTLLFILILILLTVFYVYFIKKVREGKLSRRVIWSTLIISSVILTFSYNLLSHDIFNYIFDARIVTKYGLNPYEHKALDFPEDPMLSFMHWTHRTYPYGPTWLGVTVPLSFLGLNYFLPTFFLFKALMTGAYLGTAYFIEKVLRSVDKKNALLGVVFFAFNPLVILEVLVSGHNDVVMIFFCMVGLVLFISKKYILSWLSLLFSVGIKFASGFLVPLLILIQLFRRRGVAVPWEKVWYVFIVAMSCAVIAASLRTNYQPWYFLLVIPFGALLPDKKSVLIPVIIFSLTSLLNYIPYLYTGGWDQPIPFYLTSLNILSAVGALIVGGIFYIKERKSI